MDSWTASSSGTTSHPAFGAEEPRSSVDLKVVSGVALIALGAGLFGFGLYHAFSHGSCSTTGYSAHYGPVQRCPGGIGWWMVVIFAALLASGLGIALFSRASNAAIPLLFIALGAPFIALALRSGNIQLLNGSSAQTGKLFAGVFGGCFVIAGVLWGAFAGAAAFSDVSPGSRLASALAFACGVALAAVITTGVSNAIGKQTTPAPAVVTPVTVPLPTGTGTTTTTHPKTAARTHVGHRPGSTTVRSTHVTHITTGSGVTTIPPNTAATLSQAQTQIRIAEQLATCVQDAHGDITKIEACQAKYVP